MKESAREFPLDIKISFKALFDKYRENADKGSAFQKKRAKTVLQVAEEHPILSEGFTTDAEIAELKPQIDLVSVSYTHL
tara:strand:+ start:520 stop:756 length:237 start_codon:yes stop_codon:yes gene_type:complete